MYGDGPSIHCRLFEAAILVLTDTFSGVLNSLKGLFSLEYEGKFQWK